MGEMTDAELVQASRRGEHAAFGALVERYQGVVCAVSYSRTGDRALSEDVAQETFIAAWRQLDTLRETVKLRAWLCGIARNLAGKVRRRTARETTLEGQLVFEGANPFDDACDAQSERVVREALARVPETYRDALVLYYCEHLSAREVADTLAITEAAALQRLSRGRQCLADGVADRVERGLRGQRWRKLAACVIAALPAVIPSRVDASTSSHGGTMIKIALIAATVAVTGTTAVIVHQTRSPSSLAVTVMAAPSSAQLVTPITPAQPTAPAIASARRATLPKPAVTPGGHAAVAPEPDASPTIDRATITRLELDRGPSRGPADAPVTIVMFTDTMCTYCGKVLASIDQVWDEYPNKLRLVVKQFPVHQQSILAAEASLAAEDQDKFWELHEQMFAHQDDLSHDALVEYARQAGLDVARFRAALDQHSFAAALATEQAAAREIDVTATPEFLINGRRFVGARPVADLRATIAAALLDPR